MYLYLFLLQNNEFFIQFFYYNINILNSFIVKNGYLTCLLWIR